MLTVVLWVVGIWLIFISFMCFATFSKFYCFEMRLIIKYFKRYSNALMVQTRLAAPLKD